MLEMDAHLFPWPPLYKPHASCRYPHPRWYTTMLRRIRTELIHYRVHGFGFRCAWVVAKLDKNPSVFMLGFD